MHLEIPNRDRCLEIPNQGSAFGDSKWLPSWNLQIKERQQKICVLKPLRFEDQSHIIYYAKTSEPASRQSAAPEAEQEAHPEAGAPAEAEQQQEDQVHQEDGLGDPESEEASDPEVNSSKKA